MPLVLVKKRGFIVFSVDLYYSIVLYILIVPGENMRCQDDTGAIKMRSQPPHHKSRATKEVHVC